MSYETINVTPVTPRIGAEVDGLTLAKPLSNHQVEELHQALAEHQVLFFRDQPLDVERHKALGRYFGELHIHPNTPGPEGHPEILPIHAEANSKRIAGNIGIPTSHVTRSRRWAAFYTSTPCRLSAETRCLRASMRPTRRCLRA